MFRVDASRRAIVLPNGRNSSFEDVRDLLIAQQVRRIDELERQVDMLSAMLHREDGGNGGHRGRGGSDPRVKAIAETAVKSSTESSAEPNAAPNAEPGVEPHTVPTAEPRVEERAPQTAA